jgi:uncharacterized protein YgbK (DUF1537 family)
MRDANLVRVLARQSRSPVGLVDVQTVAAGPEAVRARITQLRGTGVAAAIIDAVFPRDLETIGAVALDHRFSVGASGLGLGLARALVASGRVQPAGSASLGAPVGGAVACLAGSCSKATLEQIERAAAAMPVLHLDPEGLVSGLAEVESALAWAGQRLGQGPVLIASSAAPDRVAALQARHGRDASGQAIEQAMATLAAGLVERGVRRLVVAGGETAGAVVDRLGLAGFLVGPEIAAGVPVLRSIGGKDLDMLLALKSGNFGGADFFAKALAFMQ